MPRCVQLATLSLAATAKPKYIRVQCVLICIAANAQLLGAAMPASRARNRLRKYEERGVLGVVQYTGRSDGTNTSRTRCRHYARPRECSRKWRI